MNYVVLLLGLLTAFGPLSIDMYLPGLPAIAEDFRVSLSSVQLSLASFLTGIAVGQIFYGPLSDKYGRKKPLYFGLFLYLVASFLCAVSQDVNELILYRFLQALGACAGIVISRAMVRDLYQPHESAKIFSLLMLIMGVAPILAPVAGGIIVASKGWRAIFWVLTAISFITMGLIHFFLKETHTPREDARLSDALSNYLEIFKDKTFTGHTLTLSFIYAGMFCYITGSSFVFIKYYGLTPTQYSFVFGLNAMGLIIFSQVNGRLLRKYSPEKILKKVLPFSLLAGLLIFATGYFKGNFLFMCASIFLYMVCMGMIAPNSAATALTNQKRLAGSASALMGTMQFSTAALCSSLVSKLHDETLLPMSGIMGVCAVIAFALNKFLIRDE